MRIARGLVAVFLSAIALSGCATPVPQESPSASVEPLLAETAAPQPGSAPAQVFGGDCDTIFTDSDVSTAVGREVSTTTFGGIQLGSEVFTQAGGVECYWRASDGTQVYVGVLPEDTVDFVDDNECDALIELSGPMCAFSAHNAGMRLVGTVRVGDGDTAAQLSAVGSLQGLFSQRATAATSVPAPVLDPTAWLPLSYCEQYSGEANWYDGGFYDGYYTPAYRALRGGGLGQCETFVNGDADSISVAVLGGARWIEAEVAAQPGVEKRNSTLEAVYVGPELPSGFFYVDVFDGVNWLQAFVSNPEASMPAIEDLVAKLNA